MTDRKVITSRRRKSFDILKLFLPVLAGAAAYIEHVYYPDYEGVYNTGVYRIFLLLLIGIYLCGVLVSFFSHKTRKFLIYKAPFYSLIFLLLMGYDLLTVKSNRLIMPFFPGADGILNAMITDRSQLLDSVKSSLKLLFTGYFYGAVIGVVTGILCGYSKKISYWISPFLRILGPIPTTTWLPLVMAVAASLYKGSVFVIALGVWYSVTLATITGINNVDVTFYDAAKTLGATENQLIWRIAVPSAMPNIFQGLTVGMSSACTALMVAEMLGVESGLGWYITWQKSWAEYSKMYAAIILICITFISVNFILTAIKRKVLRWQEGAVK